MRVFDNPSFLDAYARHNPFVGRIHYFRQMFICKYIVRDITSHACDNRIQFVHFIKIKQITKQEKSKVICLTDKYFFVKVVRLTRPVIRQSLFLLPICLCNIHTRCIRCDIRAMSRNSGIWPTSELPRGRVIFFYRFSLFLVFF